MSKKAKSVLIERRKAKFEYQFVETLTAGLVLLGTEIKSIRAAQANLSDAFCYFKHGELWVKNLYIKEYDYGTHYNHEPLRERKLLLQGREMKRLARKIREKGFTIVPFKMFISDRGFAKLEIALATGKKNFDKRQTIKQRENDRSLARIKKFKNRL